MTDIEKKAEEILQGYEQARSMNCMSLELSRKEIIKAICDGYEQCLKDFGNLSFTSVKKLEKENAELKKSVEEKLKQITQADIDRDFAYSQVAELKAQIKKLKAELKTSYTKGMKHFANALKKYDREEGSWTDYFEHTIDEVLKRELAE